MRRRSCYHILQFVTVAYSHSFPSRTNSLKKSSTRHLSEWPILSSLRKYPTLLLQVLLLRLLPTFSIAHVNISVLLSLVGLGGGCLSGMWHAVASWTWDAQDETCGICRMAFDGCCPDCKLPGDDCPLIWGSCNHAFHLHCILKWVNSQTPQAHCPMCRREWQFKG
ncbi:Anaphase-promoting complex subunit [Sesamum alatum]|nr:Anaphase-promoting complex subunit [Sesamum alatum]